jgi:hypothetical protein
MKLAYSNQVLLEVEGSAISISLMPEATCQFQHCLQKKRCALLSFMFFEDFRATLFTFSARCASGAGLRDRVIQKQT